MSFNWSSTLQDLSSDDEDSYSKSTDKQSLLFFVDAAPSMLLPAKYSSLSPFIAALKCISDFMKLKIAESTDHIALVFYNSTKTDNKLGQGAPGFFEKFKLGLVELDWILELEQIIADPFDFLEEIGSEKSAESIPHIFWLASRMITDSKSKLHARKSVFIVTNDDNPADNNIKIKTNAKTKARVF